MAILHRIALYLGGLLCLAGGVLIALTALSAFVESDEFLPQGMALALLGMWAMAWACESRSPPPTRRRR